jgi:hypothetical protein
MAKPVIAIQFPSPATPQMMHRAMNFIEDVFRFAEDKAIGSVNDIDHYRDGRFIVTISASRHFGEMHREISKLLRQHMLEGNAVVSRPDRERVSNARDV